MQARFVGSEIYRGSSYGARHPLRVPRVSTVMDLVASLGWLPPGSYVNSPRAKPKALTRWHTPPYIAALENAERAGQVSAETQARHGLGTIANPVFPEMFRRPATGVGGVLLAAEHLASGLARVMHVPGGGTHHGLPDRANGFCYLNDVVLAVLALRDMGLRRVAYVDIDAHHCDGVAAAFANEPDVLMVSVHEERRWPFTGGIEDSGCGNAYNLPVPSGFNDTEMRAVRNRLILPLVTDHFPDVVVVQCGADSLAEDPLSRLSLSNSAYWTTVAALRDIAPRLLVLGGGGYNPWSAARCWSGIWATLAGMPIPDHLPEPAQSILAALHWNGGARPLPDPSMLATLRDPPREGPLRAEVTDRIGILLKRISGRLVTGVRHPLCLQLGSPAHGRQRHGAGSS
jgi:acetoin utilization protein AcuC